jgi:hypothetical protein
MEAYEISKAVNSPRNGSAELLQRVREGGHQS